MRKRKMLVMLPVITLPFITLAFWALGGGKGHNNSASSAEHKGLNMELPSAVFGKQKDLDKLGYYQKADADSDKIKAMIRNDPFYNEGASNHLSVEESDGFRDEEYGSRSEQLVAAPPKSGREAVEKNEAALLAKLDQLKKVLDQTDTTQKKEDMESLRLYDDTDDQHLQLSQMTQAIGGEDPNENKQLDQLSNMLDKILDIQHPGRLKEQQAGSKNSTRVYAATVKNGHPYYSILDSNTVGAEKSGDKVTGNGFYSTQDNKNNSASLSAIAAQVHSTQTLVSGGIVKLRLLSDLYIDGRYISKNQFVYGVASLSGERLHIEVKSIRSASNIYPVKLKVFDMDGLEGIYVPGAITTDALKQSADQTIQTLGINSISNSLSVQAASAGIEALKNMVSKKVKLIKVTVKAGYRVLLVNEGR